jgi:hypothetical protein
MHARFSSVTVGVGFAHAGFVVAGLACLLACLLKSFTPVVTTINYTFSESAILIQWQHFV